MGVDEGNKRIMYSTWLYWLDKDNSLSMKLSLISRYHPSLGEGRGVKKTYPC
jgi:hypothetical protein